MFVRTYKAQARIFGCLPIIVDPRMRGERRRHAPILAGLLTRGSGFCHLRYGVPRGGVGHAACASPFSCAGREGTKP